MSAETFSKNLEVSSQPGDPTAAGGVKAGELVASGGCRTTNQLGKHDL
jgi:hypothetical protein